MLESGRAWADPRPRAALRATGLNARERPGLGGAQAVQRFPQQLSPLVHPSAPQESPAARAWGHAAAAAIAAGATPLAPPDPPSPAPGLATTAPTPTPCSTHPAPARHSRGWRRRGCAPLTRGGDHHPHGVLRRAGSGPGQLLRLVQAPRAAAGGLATIDSTHGPHQWVATAVRSRRRRLPRHYARRLCPDSFCTNPSPPAGGALPHPSHPPPMHPGHCILTKTGA